MIEAGYHASFFHFASLAALREINMRAWKGFDWETMNRLHEKGYISNPKSAGQPDDDLWALCQKEKRLLITTDKGFTQNRNEAHAGNSARCYCKRH